MLKEEMDTLMGWDWDGREESILGKHLVLQKKKNSYKLFQAYLIIIIIIILLQ